MRHFVPFVFLWFIAAGQVNASSLFGKVIEVNSGDVITISNLNRPVRVRLLGVDAPELDQEFGDVAKKHLADLIYNKSVLVEYAGISGDHSLNGRVLLEGADVGAQMIRDGVAWVDPGNERRLSETDREVYEQSELAARLEGRGLWQQDNPVPPWEFAKEAALRRNPAAALSTIAPSRTPAPDRPTPELNSMTLMASRIAAASSHARRTLNSSDLANIASPTAHGNWRTLRPARESFSALVPEEGEVITIPSGGDPKVRGQMYRGRDGWSIFLIMWVTAPTYGETDEVAIKQSLASFLKGFGKNYAIHTSPAALPTFSCEPPENSQDISMAGYTGSEFDLSSCTIASKVRIFTRAINGDRHMYLASTFYLEQDDNVRRFLNSFTIAPPAKSKSPKK